jgi:hypothetical protein
MQGYEYEHSVYDSNDNQAAYAEFVGGAGERVNLTTHFQDEAVSVELMPPARAR